MQMVIIQICCNIEFQKCAMLDNCITAVCIHRLVMVSIDLSETTQPKTKSETILFSDKIFFLTKKMSLTGYCLVLNFVSDLVSNYIPQLYFVCNHLMFEIVGIRYVEKFKRSAFSAELLE